MDTPSPSIRKLARRLLDLEAAHRSGMTAHTHAAARVCDKLRISMTRLAGSDAFASLLRRALALARADVPSLQSIQVNPDCSIEGLEEPAADALNGDPGVAIIAHFLGLLVTFIGEPLTLRLLRKAWPDVSLDG